MNCLFDVVLVRLVAFVFDAVLCSCCGLVVVVVAIALVGLAPVAICCVDDLSSMFATVFMLPDDPTAKNSQKCD